MAERSGKRAMVLTPVSSRRASTAQSSRRKTAAFSSLKPCASGFLPRAWLGEARRAFIQAHQLQHAARPQSAPALRTGDPVRAQPIRCTGPTPP